MSANRNIYYHPPEEQEKNRTHLHTWAGKYKTTSTINGRIII